MSFHDATVPAFLQILGSLSGLLTKAEAHCKAKNIQPEVLLNARLYPDMYPLTRQIQTVCDFAGKTCARLTGSEVPSTPDTEKSFEELQQRIAKAVDYVKSFKPAQFEGGDTREVTFPIGPNNTMTMKGQQYLVNFAFPNFYFHAATAHGILRHNGVEIGKRDFHGGEVTDGRSAQRSQFAREVVAGLPVISRGEGRIGKMTGRAANWPSHPGAAGAIALRHVDEFLPDRRA